jgi:hypothetical protein
MKKVCILEAAAACYIEIMNSFDNVIALSLLGELRVR